MSVCLTVCLSVSLYVCMSHCMSVSLYVCMSHCMYVCLTVCLSVSLSVCLSHCLSVCFTVSVCMSAGPYLIVAKHRKLLGRIEGQDIFEASNFEVIPFVKSNHHMTESQVSYNKQHLSCCVRTETTFMCPVMLYIVHTVLLDFHCPVVSGQRQHLCVLLCSRT